jgi:hypothetical protein
MHCLLHLCTIRCAYFLNGAHCAALYPSVTGVLLSPSVLNISLEFSMSGLYKTTCQNIYKTQSFAPTNFCGLKDCGVFLYLWCTQAMRFGRLPDWALDLSSQIRNSVLKFKSMDLKCSKKTDPISSPSMAAQSQCPLPEDILLREPLFDQMIANSYEPGEGIKAHVDLLRFEDGIAIVSLLSPCVMCFRSVPDPLHSCPNKVNEHINEDNQLNDTRAKVQILLSPGDLIVMSGTARYKWSHEINRNKDQQVWQGEALKQERRISVTLRRLCPQLVLGD